ncbi:hypothetical protein ABNQ39_23605 [Azospirillum sp. A26]|uniref:hypothetical protein n=1 Tax=Azospirillum sp. A26 TaxID=3160607 RepID=UPI00366E57CD
MKKAHWKGWVQVWLDGSTCGRANSALAAASDSGVPFQVGSRSPTMGATLTGRSGKGSMAAVRTMSADSTRRAA